MSSNPAQGAEAGLCASGGPKLCEDSAIAMALAMYPCPTSIDHARQILRRMLIAVKNAKARALTGDRRAVDYASLMVWLPFCWASKCSKSQALYEFDWRAEVDAVLNSP